MLLRVLVAIPQYDVRRRVATLLRREGLDPAQLTARQTLWERLTHEDYDLVILGAPLPAAAPDALISSIRSLPEHPDLIVIRPREDAEERARLLAAGCRAVLWENLADETLAPTLHTLLERLREEAQQRFRVRSEDGASLSDFAYGSPAMQQLLRLTRRVALTHSTVLVLGETGVGKERLARAIHWEGPRAGGPFVAVNCGALAESLLESELFGHEEGAFTGATRSRKGYFELAHQGTIFLDEIGEMPTHLQVKLLRVLEQNQFRRVGGERPVKVDVRVIAATNRDLRAEIEAQRFRLDLYYRLAVVTVSVPPLRERREDIPSLVNSYIKHFAAAMGRPPLPISPAALQVMTAHSWPGNVRELMNVIERAVLLSVGTAIEASDLPLEIGGAGAATRDGLAHLAIDANRPLAAVRMEILDWVDREYLGAVLRASGGRVGDTARRAGLNPRTLYSLMKRHRLTKAEFKI